VTQADVLTAIPAAPPRPAPSGLRGLGGDLVAIVLTPFRLLAKHWPVLFAVATAGVFAREAFIRAAIWVARFNAVVAFLIFLFALVSVMVAMVAMLRSVRPSLPAASALPRPKMLLSNLGNVLIPFAAFYVAFGFFQEDFIDYTNGLLNAYNNVFILATGGPRYSGYNVWEHQTVITAVVAGAFLLRWALDKWELTRRKPVLALPGAYLEILWVTLGAYFVIKPYTDQAMTWIEQRVVWHSLVVNWDGLTLKTGVLGQAYRAIDGWFVDALPLVNKVFIIPLAGLVAASVVYGVTVSEVLRPQLGAGRIRWIRWVVGGVAAAASRRFGPLIAGVRAMLRAGSVPMMLFCLAVTALQTGVFWLRQLEWTVLGPRDGFTLKGSFQQTIDGFNDVVLFVLLVCVLAAAADRVTRRTAHLEPSQGTPPPPPSQAQPAFVAAPFVAAPSYVGEPLPRRQANVPG
jgi:hypothetical protein